MPGIRLRIGLLAAVGALLAATALATTATAAPSINAPKVAHVGDKIVVTASGLRAARYVLTLEGGTPPDAYSVCAAQLTSARSRRGAVRLEARIPSRFGCYSGYPSSTTGRTTTTPGRYKLIVAVPRSFITFDRDFSFLTSKLKLRD